MRLESVNLAVVRTGDWTGRVGRTGIDKRPADGPVHAGRLGLAGDTICDTREHGGPYRAAYAYAIEDLCWWSAEVGRELRPGSFGENLTTSGVDVNAALVGERWAIGSAVFEVTYPRLPCRVFAGFWDVHDLVSRFIDRARPGTYLRTVTEGEVTAGDPLTVTHHPGHHVTIGETFAALTTEPHLLLKLTAVLDYLPPGVRTKVRNRAGLVG
jgi:MOSC domain-containing protein YiiM